MMSIYSGVCRIYTPRHSVQLRYPYISVQPPSLLEEVLDRACLRCTWRRRSSELRDALGGQDRASLEMRLEAMIVRTCMPWLSEFGYALGDWDRVNSEMHLEARIEQVWKFTWRPWSCELVSRNRASLEIHLEAMIERDWRSTWRCSIWREARRQLRLYSLVNMYLLECRELSTSSAERWETCWEWETVDLEMMLYLVYAVLCVNSWLWHGAIERDDLTSCS